MSDMNSINLTEHNDRVAALVVWLLDRNAPMRSLGFNLSDNTMRLIRELRDEIHHGEEWTRETLKPCPCKRCKARVRRRARKVAA